MALAYGGCAARPAARPGAFPGRCLADSPFKTEAGGNFRRLQSRSVRDISVISVQGHRKAPKSTKVTFWGLPAARYPSEPKLNGANALMSEDADKTLAGF